MPRDLSDNETASVHDQIVTSTGIAEFIDNMENRQEPALLRREADILRG
jgi:hypothetical protein